MQRSERPFDIILWGATGFTGQIVASYLAKNAPRSVNWTIAGRSRSKLDAVKASILTYFPEFPNDPIIADSSNKESLTSLCNQTRLIISTVGPYKLYGDQLVEACVDNQVDYVDITGEVDWVTDNYHKYHAKCQENGTMIISCCGFDCMPSDLGVHLLLKEAERQGKQLTHVKGCVYKIRGEASGGTIATVMNMSKEPLAKMKKQAADDKAQGKPMINVYYDEEFKGAQGMFPLSIGNEQLVKLSKKVGGYGDGFKYQETARYANIVTAWLWSIGMIVGLMMLRLAAVRWIALKFLPAPGEGPSVEAQLRGLLEMHFIGTLEKEGEASTKIKSRYRINLDPGYAGTALMLSTAALAIVERREEMTGKSGGVLTPATAMGDVLVEELIKRNVQLSLVE